MNAQEFDRKFDEGKEDIAADLDLDTARRPERVLHAVSVDFPQWMLETLDREAARLGATRQSIVRIWLAEKLDRIRDKH